MVIVLAQILRGDGECADVLHHDEVVQISVIAFSSEYQAAIVVLPESDRRVVCSSNLAPNGQISKLRSSFNADSKRREEGDGH